ncbi:MAG: hypothetical protein DELT_01944 [Desulfovibrio sp.]
MESSRENTAPHGPETPAQYMMPPKASLDIGSIIGRTFTVLMKNPVVFFGLPLVTMIPSAIFIVVLPESAGVATNIVETIFNFIVQGAIAYAVYQALQDKVMNMNDALSSIVPVIGPLVSTAIISSLGILLGLLLLIVPGLILLCVWAVVVPACVVEKLGAMESLKRSAFLTKGHRWPLFALALMTVLFMLLVAGGVSLLVTFLTANETLGALVGTLLSFVPMAFSCVLYAIVYYDLRVLKEGVSLSSLTNVFD